MAAKIFGEPLRQAFCGGGVIDTGHIDEQDVLFAQYTGVKSRGHR